MQAVMRMSLRNESGLLLLNRTICGMAKHACDMAAKLTSRRSMRRPMYDMNKLVPTQTVCTAPRTPTKRTSDDGGVSTSLETIDLDMGRRRVLAAFMNDCTAVTRFKVRPCSRAHKRDVV